MQVDLDSDRIRELSAALLEANESSVLFSKRCENFEIAIGASAHELAAARDLNERLAHENEEIVQNLSRKDQEVSQLRSEISRLFDKNHHETKIKDRELSQCRSEIDALSSRLQMLEQVNAALKIENEKIMSELRGVKEASKQIEVTAGVLEGKLSRSNASLESVRTAKAHIEQSRAALTSRLESTLQAFRAREIDVKRLENELAQNSARLDDQNASHEAERKDYLSQIDELQRILRSKQDQIDFLESSK